MNVFSDQAASQYNLPPSVMSQIVWDMELETPSAVNAQASALARNLKSTGSLQNSVAQLYAQKGMTAKEADKKAANILTAANLPAAGEEKGPLDAFVEGWNNGPIGRLWGNYKDGLGMAGDMAEEKVSEGFWSYFTNGGFVVIGLAVLVLAILANDKARSALATVVTKGKA